MERHLVALFNLKDGGYQDGVGHQFTALRERFSCLRDDPPSLVQICEGKYFRRDGGRGLHGAAQALREAVGVPYVGVLGHMSRGPMPPALFYDHTRLALKRWYADDDEFEDKRNTAHFETVDGAQLVVIVQHWPPASGTARLEAARRVDRWGSTNLPVLLGGDLNCLASGPHMPAWDGMKAGPKERAHKGRRLADGRWVADTAAVDHLIGRWQDGGRVDGLGFEAVCELAAATGTPAPQAFAPTVQPGVDAGGQILIDWLLVNAALSQAYVPGSYRVWDTGDEVLYSDHRMVTAAYCL